MPLSPLLESASPCLVAKGRVSRPLTGRVFAQALFPSCCMHARKAGSAVAPAGRRHPRAASCEWVAQLPHRKRRDASGMNPDLPNWERRAFLHDLCAGGKGYQPADAIERAQILLDAGASISARDEEYRS